MDDVEVRFRAVYDDNHAALLGYALRRSDSPQDAADVVAETFLIAWRRLGDVPQGDRARLWLYGTARRVVANQVRSSVRRRNLAERLGAELAVAVPGPGEPDEDASAVGVAFRRLPEPDRELLLLAAWEELDAGQIAEVLGCSRGAVRVRLHRARRRLRQELEADGLERRHRPGHQGSGWAAARPGIEEGS